jgi:hypothetical protein
LEGLFDLLFIKAHDAPIVNGKSGKGAAGIQSFHLFGGPVFFFALEKVDFDKIIFHPQLIEELLRFSTPDTGAQGIENNFPFILPGDVNHSHIPFPPPFILTKKFIR